MVFSSLGFLFIFFPAVLIVYLVLAPGLRNAWLLAASVAFYRIGDADHLPLLLSMISIAYVSGLIMPRIGSRRLRKVFLFASVALMIGMMSYYKYWDFMITNLNALLGEDRFPIKRIAFPMGISFFAFQAVSYVVDVYRGEECMRDPIDMGLYIAFFPQLIAGPIVRYHDIRAFMDKSHRAIDPTKVGEGVWRFCVGLSKKVLLANNLGGLADTVFGIEDISRFSVLYAWLGAIAYTLQIYYDFSGYSDMAIGLGRIFGFEFQENFNYPYRAGSIREFWRRWHISLSQFFRDYVYIPLGGNRCSPARWAFNMMTVWLLTGLWHGASWNYVLWGAAYGVLLLAERIFPKGDGRPAFVRAAGHAYTMMVVILLWVVFRSGDPVRAYAYIRHMLGIGASSFIDGAFVFQTGNFAVLIAVAIAFCVPAIPALDVRLEGFAPWEWAKTAALFVCTVLSVSYIFNGSYNPFLYFMF